MKRLLIALAVFLGFVPTTGISCDLARAHGIQPGTVALGHGEALLDPFLVRAGFEGAASPPDWWHPDDTIAAGPANLVLHGNSTIAIRSKTGALAASMSVRDFFASVRNPDEGVSDPWIVFDPLSQRFFYVADGSGPGNPHFVSCAPCSCVAHHLIAVSKSAAPATLSPNDWYFYALDRTIYRTKDGIVQTANWGDFDSLAIDETAVVIKWSAYAFGVASGAPGQAQGVKVRVVDKGKLIRGETPTTWTDIELKDPQTGGLWMGPTEPAMDSGSPGPFFLLSARGCDVVVWAIDHARDVTSRQFTRDPCSAGSPAAVQPGGAAIDPVHNGHSLVYRNGSLWYAHLVGHDFGSGLVSAIRWIQLDVSGWPESVRIVQDAVFGEAGSWQLGPAIMVDAAGNAVIVFARSSTTEFPSLYFTGRLASDPPNLLRPAALLKAGTTSWEAFSSATGGRNRYIDFLGAALDPADGSIWVYGPYVKAPRQRGTWAANIVPPAALPTLAIDGCTVAEGSAVNAAFRLVLSAASTQTVTVQYSTANATAVADSDYTAASGTLSFTPGRTRHSIFVPIVTDTIAEGSETFFVNLSNPQNAILGTKSQGVGTIADPPAAAKAAMYRSYSKSTDYHFFTTDLASKNFAVGVLGFQDESNPIPFYVWNSQQSGTVPLFRMYSPNLGRHFYTASTGSRNFLMGIGALYEKEEGFVYPLSTSPVPSGTTELFLLYNNNSGTHLFTADANQKSAILSLFQGVWVQHTSVGFVFP